MTTAKNEIFIGLYENCYLLGRELTFGGEQKFGGGGVY